MRSRHHDKFNHDDQAEQYDDDVSDESHPHRAGYRRLLTQVAAACRDVTGALLDLGAGTGLLASLLPPDQPLTCVDISVRMLERARLRLAARAAPCDFVVEDLLGYFEEARGPFAAVASTYAIHHLEQGEKHILFAAVRQSLLPGGCAVFGDLMFADRSAEKEFKEECLRTGRRSLVEDIEDEYFWRIDEEIAVLRKLGFRVEKHRVSQLSWIVRADLA